MVNCAKDCANGLSGGASFKTISPVAVSNGQNRRHKKRPAIEQVVMVRIYQSIFDYCKPPVVSPVNETRVKENLLLAV